MQLQTLESQACSITIKVPVTRYLPTSPYPAPPASLALASSIILPLVSSPPQCLSLASIPPIQIHPRRSTDILCPACRERRPVFLEALLSVPTTVSASCKSYQLRYPRSYLRTCDAPSHTGLLRKRLPLSTTSTRRFSSVHAPSSPIRITDCALPPRIILCRVAVSTPVCPGSTSLLTWSFSRFICRYAASDRRLLRRHCGRR